MLYTFDYSLAQLERCHDHLYTGADIARIIHLVYEDLLDHYIVVVDCDSRTAVFLSLL
jgi:hypothetical protein